MDKLKPLLTKLKRYHFWVLCLVVLLLGIFAWFKGVGGMAQETKTRASAIEGDFKKISDRTDAGPMRENHPNEDFQKGMDELIVKRAVEVIMAWKKRWQQQAAILVWPGDLGSDFIKQVADLQPIETKVPYGSDQGLLTITFRERYRDYIQRELPKLAEIIGSRWDADRETPRADAPAAGGSGLRPLVRPDAPGPEAAAEEEVLDDRVVIWAPENQRYIRDTRFNWEKSQDRVPSTLELLYAQEDLWVLTALMQIIHDTNGGVDSRLDAVIREIKSIKIGRDAVQQSGQILRSGNNGPGAAPASGGGEGESGGGGPAPVHTGGGGGDESSAGAAAGSDPAEGRYVNKAYQPLPAQFLRTGAESTNLENLYLAVAKRVPVRLNVVMDQRYINRLLVECANSDLTVEVRQLRVLPLRAGESARSVDKKFKYDREVEIYGIVYIYNPVDDKLFERQGEYMDRIREKVKDIEEKEEGGTSETEGTTAPATPPATAPATPPTEETETPEEPSAP